MRRLLGSACIALVLAIGTNANAAISVDVYPAFAPVGPVSPNWNAWVANAINFLQTGSGDAASRSNPADFELIPLLPNTVPNSEFIVTTFNSWRGQAGPAAPFDGEFGNRWHAPVRIQGDGAMEFALKDIMFVADSSDPQETFDMMGSLAGLSFSDTRIGVQWGADNMPGGGDDIVYDGSNPGTDATLVDAMYYVGIGDGFFMDGAVEGETQADIDAFIGSACPCAEISVGYQVKDSMGTVIAEGAESFSAIPEPSTGIMALFGIFGLISTIRRRKLGKK